MLDAILSLDIGTSSTRALLWDTQGNLVKPYEAQIKYALHTTPDGGAEIPAEEMLQHTASCIDSLLRQVEGQGCTIRAVGISTFWHSMVGIDRHGNALTPIYMWADTRSAPQANRLRLELNELRLHRRTGCRIHPSYYPAKLVWLRETQPEAYRAVDRWVSPCEYFFGRLFGVHAIQVSVSMASGTGLMNQEACVWDAEAFRCYGLAEEKFSPIVNLNEPARGLRAEFAERWASLKEVPFFPAVGDGACGNVGSGCTSPERFAINLGTSGAVRVLWHESQMPTPPIQPSGCWYYRIDKARPLIGTAFSDGGNVFDWLQKSLKLPPRDELEAYLQSAPPGGHGLVFLPFMSGERGMNWNPKARSAFVGMNLDTSPVDIVHAAMEAIALRFTLATGQLSEVFPQVREVIASGGVLSRSPAWAQIFASALGQPITLTEEPEASSRGAAFLAMEAEGSLGDMEWETRMGKTYLPNTENFAQYQELLAEQEEYYRRVMADSSTSLLSPSST